MKFEFGQVYRDGERPLLTRVRRPLGLLARARGLIGSAELGTDEGMWFDRCDSIHMFGMRFAIDVVFVREKHVERLCPDVRPLRARWCRRADSVLELATGSIERLALAPEQPLQFRRAA